MVQVSKGVEIRAQIDTEQSKSLLLLNGGGAIALLALLPKTFEIDKLAYMTRPALAGIFLMAMGLVAAVVHNYYRRQCSLSYESHNMKPPGGSVFGMNLHVPVPCFLSRLLMTTSLLCFALSVCLVAISGWIGLS